MKLFAQIHRQKKEDRADALQEWKDLVEFQGREILALQEENRKLRDSNARLEASIALLNADIDKLKRDMGQAGFGQQ